MSKFRTAISVFFKSAKNELAFFFVILAMAVITAAVVFPVVLAMAYLPDWCWWIWGVVFLGWMLFGDSIGKAWDAYKDKHHEH